MRDQAPPIPPIQRIGTDRLQRCSNSVTRSKCVADDNKTKQYLTIVCLASQDNVLSTMHGAKAFKDFIDKKNTRVPEFLEVVAEQQEQVNKMDTDEASQERKKSRAISTSSQFGSTNYVF